MLLRDLLLPTYLCLGLVSFGASAQKLKAIYEWKYVDYLWDTEADRTEAIQSGDYNFTQAVIIDSDVAEDGRVFVTVIRGKGVPASLTTISDKSGDGGPLLRPYPNWSWARKGDCNSITSVYRVAVKTGEADISTRRDIVRVSLWEHSGTKLFDIDECNRLWVMDNGKISGTQVCPAQLLAFDLKTDRLLKRVKIPDNIAQNSTTGQGLLITPIVETEGPRCKRTFVYIADVQGYALVVYDGNSVWRLNSSVYVPQKSAADVEIAGETFHLADGVLGMALSPKRQRIFGPPESRYLVFRPYASYDMVAAKTTNLRNSRDGSNVNYNIASGVLPSQAVAMAFSSQGVLFFGLNKEMALGCWNMNKPLTQQNIILADQNSITEQFASGLKVLPKRVTRRSEKIWMVTNRYQKVAQGTQDFSEINYRILTGSVDDVLANTRCDPKLGFFGWKY